MIATILSLSINDPEVPLTNIDRNLPLSLIYENVTFDHV